MSGDHISISGLVSRGSHVWCGGAEAECRQLRGAVAVMSPVPRPGQPRSYCQPSPAQPSPASQAVYNLETEAGGWRTQEYDGIPTSLDRIYCINLHNHLRQYLLNNSVEIHQPLHLHSLKQETAK